MLFLRRRQSKNSRSPSTTSREAPKLPAATSAASASYLLLDLEKNPQRQFIDSSSDISPKDANGGDNHCSPTELNQQQEFAEFLNGFSAASNSLENLNETPQDSIILPSSQSRPGSRKQNLHSQIEGPSLLLLPSDDEEPEDYYCYCPSEREEETIISTFSTRQPSDVVNRVLSGATLRPEPESQRARERRAAALDWLAKNKSELDLDRHVNSFERFREFLDCAYTVYLAGKSGWDANCPADHFASAIDQAAHSSHFNNKLIQDLLLLGGQHGVEELNLAEMEGSGVFPAMPNPPPPAIVPQLDSQSDFPTENKSDPSIFRKDVFLDWHQKFAFARPTRLGAKEVLPTIQLPALAGGASRSDDVPPPPPPPLPTGSPSSQERPTLQKDDEGSTPTPVETPHPEMYEPHPGLIELGRSLYTPQPRSLFSDSPLNMPRQAEKKPAPLPPRPSPSPAPTSTSTTNMQLSTSDDTEGDGYVYYGNQNLQNAILSGEVDPYALIDRFTYEEEHGIEVLAPLVEAAVLKGRYDTVVELVQRNIQCIDVAMKTAEENGKFALVKYLGLLKDHYRRYGDAARGGRPAGPLGPNPGYGGPSSAANLGVPGIPHRPRSSTPSQRGGGNGNRGRLTPSNEPNVTGRAIPHDHHHDDLVVDEDDSEEVWKLRAIYLLVLMIVLSETTSSDGWDSVSTASSSRQSSQAPVDSGEYNGAGHGGSSARLGLPSGAGRRQGTGGSGDKKKKREEEESDESEGNNRKGPRNRRPSNLRSLGRRYACPFAKAEPDTNVTCWTINRQNLAGVKEHLKRFHFGGLLPSDIRAARTWDEVFDVIAPDWGNRPRPSPYVDMLDIFQRSVRQSPLVSNSTSSAPSLAPESALSPTAGWATLPLQQPHTTSPGLSINPQTTTGLGDFGQLSPDTLGPGAYGMGLLYPSGQQPFQRASRSATPASASVGGFDNYGGLHNQPVNTTSLSGLNLPTTTQSFNPMPSLGSSLGSSLPFGGFISQLAAPHFTNVSAQELSNQFAQSNEFFFNEFGIDTRQPASQLFTDIMDPMEPVAPGPQISGLPPVFESSPEPDSAVSGDTIRGMFYPGQQQPQISQPTTTPSVISSTGISASGTSAYPSSSTSMGIHSTMAPATAGTGANALYSTPGAASATTPINISHASSPPSTTGSRERRYQLLISRNPAIPGSTETPGHKTFYFESHEDFMRNFEGYMRWEFNDPGFNWEGWELMNPVTKARLGSAEAVYLDADFTFVAHMQTRAGLYLVPRDI
ncbi:hypothetical protein AA313_de0205690 [Arthrobotrys entomopaga]|nr:hypothetical protein AA313_de0205690 [Arthrobotrys entomopaga]